MKHVITEKMPARWLSAQDAEKVIAVIAERDAAREELAQTRIAYDALVRDRDHWKQFAFDCNDDARRWQKRTGEESALLSEARKQLHAMKQKATRPQEDAMAKAAAMLARMAQNEASPEQDVCPVCGGNENDCGAGGGYRSGG